jgi:hypothetical protein
MPVVGTPFPSKDALIQVSDIPVAPATPTWKDVGLMTGWSTDANEELTETDVFMQADPLSNVGREHVTFTLDGLLSTADDDGQALIAAHVTARDYFLLQVLWDGTNGFNAQVRVSTRKKSGKAGNNFPDTEFVFQVKPSTIVAVLDGPTI